MAENDLRSLSVRQAAKCEEAKEPACHCRCGGALHGAKRNGGSSAGAAFFAALPDDDPHHIDSKEQRAAKKRAEKEAFEHRRAEYLRQHNEQMAAFYREHPEMAW